MLKLLLSLALSQSAPALPPPPEAPAEMLFLPVRMHGSVSTGSESRDDSLEGMQLIMVDERPLRVQVLLRHDELEIVDLPAASAWRLGGDLRIILPLASRAATPFEPVCCVAYSLVDLQLTLPGGMPEQVTVSQERPERRVIGEQRLVPQR